MKTVTFSVTLLALIFAFSSCEKCVERCNPLAAKIIRYDCDRVILQLLDSTSVGDNGWVDVQTGEQYNNVVSYYNTCKINEITKGAKTTIYVQLKQAVPNPPLPDCVRCEALSQSPPNTKVDFADISKTACETQTNK